VAAVDLATPHIAGYSAQAKRNAMQILLGKLTDTFDIENELSDSVPSRPLILSEILPQKMLISPASIVGTLYPLIELSEQMKFQAIRDEGLGFDAQRSKLRLRNEFQSYVVDKSIKLNEPDRQLLRGLSFQN
jgi:hypothetical protein